MKKFKSLIVIFLLGFSIFNSNQLQINAEEQTEVHVTNEYDQFVKEKKELGTAETKKLLSRSMKKETTYEELYLERAKLSKETLIKEYFYTPEQVTILKKYDGRPIEKAPELRKASATMNLSFRKAGASTSDLYLLGEWKWSSAPILSGPAIKDGVAFGWNGTDNSGHSINLAYQNSYATVYYYSGGSLKKTLTYNAVCDNQYHAAHVYFPMDQGATALKGSFQIHVKRVGSKAIKEAAFTFVYGHSSIAVNVGFSFSYGSAGVGINVNGTTKKYQKTCRYTSSGAIK
ncbi:hypothetical protein MKC54_21065 [[Clostridium] innocuum]|nr:hypothetical protein [[Clostridium] innocuum]MCR0579390.1 hypothetical protein [[Clostridium] innocuum]